MAYEKTVWIDHVEDPITGEVYTQGTPVDAAHLNKMEQGIADAIPASEKGQPNGVAKFAHGHDVTDLTNVVRSKELSPKTQSYCDVAIPLIPLIKKTTDISRYFVGSVHFGRVNSNSVSVKFDITAQDYYDSEMCRYYCWGSIIQNSNLNVLPCVFSYGGIKYFGLRIHAQTSTYENVYVEGRCTDWDTLRPISFYNNQTSAVLNQEIKDSIHYTGEDMVAYQTTFLGATPKVQEPGSQTSYNVWHSGNDGAGSDLDAGKFAGKQPYEYYQYLGGVTGGMDITSWIDSLTVGTVGTFYAGATVTNTPQATYYNGELIYNYGTDKLLRLVNRANGRTYTLRKSSGVWDTAWSDQGNADKLDGLHANNFCILGQSGRTIIADGTDFNDVKSPGAYSVASSTNMLTMLNAPSNNQGGYVDVLSTVSGNIVVQVYRGWGSLYRWRMYGGSSWGDWTNLQDGGNAAKLNNKQPYEYMQYLGNPGPGVDVLTWIDALPAGTIGVFKADAASLNTPSSTSASWEGILFVNQSNTDKAIMLTDRANNGKTYINAKGSTWRGWVCTADGGNAALLSGKAIDAANGIPTLDAYGKVKPEQTSSAINSRPASFTLALTDAGKFQWCGNNSDPITVTIPTNAAVAFPVGTEIEFGRGSPGTLTFAAASGVNILSIDNMRSVANWNGCVALKQVAANYWLLSGDLG